MPCKVRYDFISPYGTIMVRFALKMPLNSPFRRYQTEFPFGRLPVHSTASECGPPGGGGGPGGPGGGGTGGLEGSRKRSLVDASMARPASRRRRKQ